MLRVLFLSPWRGHWRQDKNSVPQLSCILSISCHTMDFKKLFKILLWDSLPPVLDQIGEEGLQRSKLNVLSRNILVFLKMGLENFACSGKACLLPLKLWFDHLSLTTFSWPCLSLGYSSSAIWNNAHKLALHSRCLWERNFGRLCNWNAFVDVFRFTL